MDCKVSRGLRVNRLPGPVLTMLDSLLPLEECCDIGCVEDSVRGNVVRLKW